MKRHGVGVFDAYSAGSMPRGEIHPYAVDLLRHREHDVSSFRSKSWEEFAGEGAPVLDFVFSACPKTDKHFTDQRIQMSGPRG